MKTEHMVAAAAMIILLLGIYLVFLQPAPQVQDGAPAQPDDGAVAPEEEPPMPGEGPAEPEEGPAAPEEEPAGPGEEPPEPEPPEAQECTETDGGLDIFTAGESTAQPVQLADYCVSQGRIMEYHCVDGRVEGSEQDCPPDHQCQDGACHPTSPAPPGSPAPQVCIDTDAGQDTTTAGTVNDGTKDFHDQCSGPTLVLEYYCENDYVKWKNITCPAHQQCANARCEPICLDPDGQDPNVKSTTARGTAAFTDTCASPDSVNEYYCSIDNELLSTTIMCATGYWCISGNGACTQKPPCVDNDGGQNTLIASTVQDPITTLYDACVNSTHVFEAICDANGDGKYVEVYCGSGSSCSGGACVLQAIVLCSDSDGGVDETVKGTTTDSSGSYTDYCLPGSWVREYFCQNSTDHSYYDVQCPAGKTCSGGICQ